MQENTNKAIAINTVILYIQMAVVTICSLLTTRFALQALGENDFGLFSLIGGIISFVGIINTIMVSVSNRYMAVAIGKGDIDEANKIFNVCLVIHMSIACLTALVAIPLGDWYINNYVNYEGDITNALMVYHWTVIASVISFISVPFHGLLMAREKFVVFFGVSILSHLLKLLAAVLLIYFFSNKLLFFTITQATLTFFPIIVFWVYCEKIFKNIVQWKLVYNKSIYREMLGFSGWIGLGAVVTVGKAQGAALLVNAFFTSAMNAALGVANTINQFILTFANNVTQPIAPQITKTYSSGDTERCIKLLVLSTKFSFLSMLLVASPFFSDIDWIMKLWLGHVPPYASLFAKLLIIDALIRSFNSGIGNVIYANGDIVFYQLATSLLQLVSILVAFFALKAGAEPYYIFVIYAVFGFFVVIATQWALHKALNFDNWILIKGSYLPSLLVLALYIPCLFIEASVHPIIHMSVVFVYLLIVVLFVGLNKSERAFLSGILNRVKTKILR